VSAVAVWYENFVGIIWLVWVIQSCQNYGIEIQLSLINIYKFIKITKMHAIPVRYKNVQEDQDEKIHIESPEKNIIRRMYTCLLK